MCRDCLRWFEKGERLLECHPVLGPSAERNARPADGGCRQRWSISHRRYYHLDSVPGCDELYGAALDRCCNHRFVSRHEHFSQFH